jgi:hypothetical protein
VGGLVLDHAGPVAAGTRKTVALDAAGGRDMELAPGASTAGKRKCASREVQTEEGEAAGSGVRGERSEETRETEQGRVLI